MMFSWKRRCFLSLPTSLHKTVLNLIVRTRYRDDIPHLPLLLRLGNLLQQGGLLCRCMANRHPSFGLITHLPGPGRDRLRRPGHRVVVGVEIGNNIVLLRLRRPCQGLGDLLLKPGLIPGHDRLALLPVLPVRGDGRR